MVLIKVILLVSLSFSSTFENVKVLDIESRSAMKKYMKSISKDLGVKCSYCHDMAKIVTISNLRFNRDAHGSTSCDGHDGNEQGYLFQYCWHPNGECCSHNQSFHPYYGVGSGNYITTGRACRKIALST